MAYRVPTRSHSASSSSQPNNPSLAQKLGNIEVVTSKNAQNSVTCVYQTHIGGYWRNVTVVWSKNVMNHSLIICVDNVMEYDFPQQTCKIDVKPWYFWAKKGYKTFEVDGIQLEAYWDLRSAKFNNGPEPYSDFYVAIVSDEEVVLLLGDYKNKAYARTKSRPALVEAIMFSKKEHVFGKKSFSTRAKFDHRKKDHDIIVESSTSGPRDPEMWISIDGIVLIHITNLQWKFRGNQTIQVNRQPVEVFWDVYAWLFRAPGSGHGLFIFKPGATDAESDAEDYSSIGTSIGTEDSNCSGNSKYYSTLSHSKASTFCLILYAWKIE